MKSCDIPMHFHLDSIISFIPETFLFKTQVGIATNASSQMSRFCPYTKYFLSFVLWYWKLFSRHQLHEFVLIYFFSKLKMNPFFSHPFSLLVHSIQTIDQMKWILERKKASSVQNATFHGIIQSESVCARLSKVKFMDELLLLIPFLPLSKSTIVFSLIQLRLNLNIHTQTSRVCVFYSIRYSFGSFIVFISLAFVTVTLALFACMRALVCVCFCSGCAPLVKGNEWHSN